MAFHPEALSLYIHFPFCLYKCHYCDFNSHARALGDIPFEAYLKALADEMALRNRLYEKTGRHFVPGDTRLKTLFLGGGTPSLWPPAMLARLLEEVGRYFTLDADTEITLESNPGTVTPQKLKEFKEAGVNRLSLGVQSLHDSYLKSFGRIHSADEARAALDAAAATGFGSWSADLIFGFPGQTVSEWKRDLEEMIAREPPHLSCYSFTVEEDAPYSKMVREGLKPAPDADLQADLFEMTHQCLKAAAFTSYEISNFARLGNECRHNLTYWNYEPYLGLGAGAVSFLQKPDFYRTTNLKEPGRYLAQVKAGDDFFATEAIPAAMAMQEFLMMGLRMREGASSARFQNLFGTDVEKVYRPALEKNRLSGKMEPQGLKLTEKGRLFANQVIGDFL